MTDSGIGICHGVVYYGQRWYEMLGYTSRDICPISTRGTISSTTKTSRLKSAIAAHLQGESECIEVEYRIRHKDGGWRWMICHGLAVRDQAGAVPGCRLAVRHYPTQTR